MLYLYDFNEEVIVTTEILFNPNCNLIKTFDFEIENKEIKFSKIENPINTVLFPSNSGYILIISKENDLKLFEKFDVLKDYNISETDLVFEIYKINNITKVFSYPFSFENYTIQCNICFDITKEPILMCKKCSKSMCSSCNIFKLPFCDYCNLDGLNSLI